MRKITPYLPRIKNDPDFRERFMLAGLFLSYRACNHMGVDLNTEENHPELKHSHPIPRIEAYRKYGLRPIRSTSDYLERINLTSFRFLILPISGGPGRFLSRFVIKNGKFFQL